MNLISTNIVGKLKLDNLGSQLTFGMSSLRKFKSGLLNFRMIFFSSFDIFDTEIGFSSMQDLWLRIYPNLFEFPE